MLIRKLFFKSRNTHSLLPVFLKPRYASTSTASEHTSPVSERETEKSPVITRLPNGVTFVRAQNISTLDPSRLVASDYILPIQWYFSVRYRRLSAILCEYGKIAARRAFPPGTSGFLYLHRPHGIHPCAATLRFRVCDRDLPPQESFARGNDLLSPRGAPWEVNLLRLFASVQTVNFREALLLDKVLSLETIEQAENLANNLAKGDRKGRSKLVFSFGQSFSISMGRRTTALRFVNLETSKLEHVVIYSDIAECTDETLSYTMRIEYDPHAKRRIVFRILQIPKELHGKTRYNEGDIMPLRRCKFPASDVADVLLRQSPSLSSFSLSSHPDQSALSSTSRSFRARLGKKREIRPGGTRLMELQ
ncbi:hypothetical protein BDP27DRAFT_1409061 [Rhodocollybia butyracea]|uniref:Uncharacterized protein n=1 Tax=Rhodocollybia butyracea TaxID=206335 RepID=A0A9P5P602_9AGAR|nr:hypothetical protein BDP27DRAFT_1409061 [Rhodocollybia butyracea]